MNDVLITILSLSVSGSALALILFAGKPLLKSNVPKTFSYYIWLLVLLRLVLPLAAPVNVVGILFSIQQPNTETVGQTDVPAATEQAGQHSGNPLNTQTASPDMPKNETTNLQVPSSAGYSVSIWNLIRDHSLWLWMSGSVISFGWFMTAYAYFSRRMRRSCITPHQDDVAVFRKMSRDHRIQLTCSSIVITPVLIGMFHPVIILPQFAYVRNGMENELKNILRHELTHYRRKDVLYKWLVVAITSLHWFNPLMLLIRREIGKACELSCDEAVISKMSAIEKKQYGNTLLAFSAAEKFPAGIIATTLSEGKTELKERLMSIMKYEKKSARVIVWTLMLTVLLTGCAVGLGASKGASASSGGAQEPSSSQTPDSDSWNGDGSSAQQSILTQIEAALDTKVPLMLPASIPVAEDHFLSAATTSQPTDYKVSFYETDQATEINSQAASGGTLIASLEGTDYQDAESAKESIGAAGYETMDLSSVDSDAMVDLGHQIKGTWDSGLGHQVLVWNEGRWCLRVDSPTDSTYQDKKYPDNEQLAKDVVAYLEDNMLPAPQEIGVIAIDIWNQNQGTTIAWQDQQTVYQISSPDPMTALKVAVATKAISQKMPEYPDTKSISITTEGEQRSEDFTLLNESPLPFLTYIPKTDWTAEQTDDGVTITHKESGSIKITFLKNGIGRQEAEKEFDNLLGDVSKYEKKEDLPKWAVSSYYLWQGPEAAGKNGSMTWAVLGLHSGRYFYIYTTHSDEIEGDFPLMQSIFKEWLWKDTNDTLDYSLN